MVDADGYVVKFRVEKLEKIRRTHKIPRISWSECRDSNSRPLEPHSSAIPNFATPGYSVVRPLTLEYSSTHFAKLQALFLLFSIIFSAPRKNGVPADRNHKNECFIRRDLP